MSEEHDVEKLLKKGFRLVEDRHLESLGLKKLARVIRRLLKVDESVICPVKHKALIQKYFAAEQLRRGDKEREEASGKKEKGSDKRKSNNETSDVNEEGHVETPVTKSKRDKSKESERKKRKKEVAEDVSSKSVEVKENMKSKGKAESSKKNAKVEISSESSVEHTVTRKKGDGKTREREEKEEEEEEEEVEEKVEKKRKESTSKSRSSSRMEKESVLKAELEEKRREAFAESSRRGWTLESFLSNRGAPPVLFCANCAMLLPQADTSLNTVVCSVCKHKTPISAVADRVSISQYVPENKASGKKVERQLATIRMDCINAQCDATEINFYTQQLRSADEGSTVFYECSACGEKWNENN